jgi:hypothetical protein
MSIDPSLNFGLRIADFGLTATPSSLATRHLPPATRLYSRATRHPPPATHRGQNWLRFSGSISPWLVLSHNAPTINTTETTSELALFCHFSITAGFTSSHSLVLRGCSDPAVRPTAGLQVRRRRHATRHHLR